MNVNTSNDNDLELAQIRRARGKFAAMAITYFIGAFNDNFYKQSALLLAVSAHMAQLQGWATVIFTMPFILFAAPAGFFSDRFSKRSVVITAKLLELTAMIFGAIGILTLNWSLVLLMLGIEGLAAAIFSPAINGSIPELYPSKYVIKANAVIRMVSTIAILAGIASAGFVLEQSGKIGDFPLSRASVAIVVVLISAVGVAVSFGVPKFPAAAPDAKYPFAGPWDTIKSLWAMRTDKLLAISIGANAVFWFIGSLEVLLINELGLLEFHFGMALTSSLVLAELLGIAAGGFLSAKLAKGERWHRVLAPAAAVMAVMMMLVMAVPLLGNLETSAKLLMRLEFMVLAAILFIMGMAGGVYMVPLEAFIQVRPGADAKGRTIAASNFASFTGILLAGPVITIFNLMQVPPSKVFGITGALLVIFAVMLKRVLSSHRV